MSLSDKKNNKLLGIILTIHGSLGGANLAFRYPTVIRSSVSEASLKSFSTSVGSSSRPPSSATPTPPAEVERSASVVSQQSSAIHSPMPSIASGSMTKVVDASNGGGGGGGVSSSSLSSPTMLTAMASGDSLSTSTPDQQQSNQQQISDREQRSRAQYRRPMAAGAPLVTHVADSPLVSKYEAFFAPSVALASIITPKHQLCERRFMLQVDNTKFIGHPVLVPRNLRRRNGRFGGNGQRKSSDGGDGDDDDGGGGGRTSHAAATSMTMLNVVIGLNHSDTREVEVHRIAAHLSNALLHEELRCGYVTAQLSIIFRVRDRFLSSVAAGQALDNNTLYTQLLESSQLARELRDVYHGLKTTGVATVLINNWVHLSLSLRDARIDPGSAYPLRPYHSILLTTTTIGGGGWQSTPLDQAPRLATFLATARPTKSFRDLELETDIPLSHLYRMASHLAYWKQGKIIDTISTKNTYIVNGQQRRLVAAGDGGGEGYDDAAVTAAASGAEATNASNAISTTTTNTTTTATATATTASFSNEVHFDRLCQIFSSLFPTFHLVDVLNLFSETKTLEQHMESLPPSKHKTMVRIVVWLLAHDLLVQLVTYVYLLLPLPTPTLATSQYSLSSSSSSNTSVLLYGGDGRYYATSTLGRVAAARTAAASERERRRGDERLLNGDGEEARDEEGDEDYDDDGKDDTDNDDDNDDDRDAYNNNNKNRKHSSLSSTITTSGTSSSAAVVGDERRRHRLRATPATNVDEQWRMPFNVSFSHEPRAFITSKVTDNQVNAWLDRIDDSTPLFTLFRSLVPYFYGQVQVEDILWREHLDRSLFDKLLATYEKYLIVVKQVKLSQGEGN